MIVSRIDPEARSTHASAKGFRALCEGDTALAREKFAEAGKILEDGAAHTESAPEKNLLRFLAASQYYHGGEYQRANRIVQRTKPKYLSQYDREKFEQFRKDVEERADSSYAFRLRKAVFDYRAQGRVEDAIRLLQDHPYVLERSALAWTRADLCLRSGRIKAAVLFSADAVRFSDFHPEPVFLRAGAATFLKSLGKPAEAVEFLQLVQSKEPTALDLVAVGVALYDRFQKGDLSVGPELLRLLDLARQDFARLPSRTVSDPDVRDYMAHGHLLAAITADALQGREQAMKYVEAGEALAVHRVIVDVFRHVRAVADTVWLHTPEITAQLATISPGLDSRWQQTEEFAFSKESTAA